MYVSLETCCTLSNPIWSTVYLPTQPTSDIRLNTLSTQSVQETHIHCIEHIALHNSDCASAICFVTHLLPRPSSFYMLLLTQPWTLVMHLPFVLQYAPSNSFCKSLQKDSVHFDHFDLRYRNILFDTGKLVRSVVVVKWTAHIKQMQW